MRHRVGLGLRAGVVLLVWAAAGGLAWAQELAGTSTLRLAPEPDWVVSRGEVAASRVAVPPAVANLGAYIAHWGTEVRVAGSQSEQFVRRLTRIQQASALSQEGVFRLDYSPDYESVEIHRVDLVRGAQRIPVLDSMAWRVSKVEPELARLMLTGKSAIVAQIPDARVGDTIDVAYTIKGRNPVFGGYFFANLVWNQPQYVHRRVVRVVQADAAPLAYRFFGPKFKDEPVPSRFLGRLGRETVFVQDVVVPAMFDNRMPRDYSPVLLLQLSTMNRWDEVNQWAVELFRAPAPSPALLKMAREFSAGVSQKQAVARAAKFVQDEIRYFSVSISENTHRPQMPDVTLERRFGDCKDKAVLLVALLGAMGVQAKPVLVSDALGSRVLGSLPSPLAFDHAVVQLRYADGSEQLVDATLSADGLPLEHQSLKLQRSVGLVVQADGYFGNDGLRALGHRRATRIADIDEVVKVGGLDKDAQANITTRMYGELATMSRQFRRQSAESAYLQAVTGYFSQRQPNARKEPGFPKIQDDKARNQIVIEEAYRVEKLLTRDNNTARWFARFGAQQLLAALPAAPWDKDRLLPLGVPLPNSIQRYRVVAEFPPEIRGGDDPVDDVLETPFFRLTTMRSFRGSTFVFEAELTVTVDEILPAGLPDFASAYQEAQKRLIDVVVLDDSKVGEAAGPAKDYRQQALAKLAKAIASSTKIIETAKLPDEDMALVYLERAMARLDASQLGDAEADLDQAARLNPSSAEVPRMRAALYLRNKQFAAAEAELGKALARGAEPGGVYLRRGQARYLAGNVAGALKDFEQAEKSTQSGLNRGFMKLWQSVARMALGQPLEQVAPQSAWPGPLQQVFAGQLQVQTLLKQIQSLPSAEERAMNLCEAYFFLALWSQAQGRQADYRSYLEKTVATGVVHFMEYELAEILLK